MARRHCRPAPRTTKHSNPITEAKMKRLHSVVAVAIAIVALLVAAPSQAQEKKQSSAQQSKRIVADKKVHRLILQVNTNDPAMMNLALNNATNVTQYYKDLGAKVTIEIVTFGPGLHMLRDDTSPVKARIKAIGKHAINLFRGLRQYPGKYEQG